MLVANNPKPSLYEFASLMKRTDNFLNNDALHRRSYYYSKSGSPLEDDVKVALDKCAKGTPFEGTIEKISGQYFPDIVAAKLYGVEVKSTKEDHWKSTGSSILESTRVSSVERIYMTFGKLGGNPIQFLSKPYEQCLYGIAVTHMPRYLIDMQTPKNETIFSKMGISYDELRKMDNPIAPVAKYYRSQLKAGESLWWAGEVPTSEDVVPVKIRMWDSLSQNEKNYYISIGLLNYPEIFAGEYDKYALWLASIGILNTHIRDLFSAGGKYGIILSSGEFKRFPSIYSRVEKYCSYIYSTIIKNKQAHYPNMHSAIMKSGPVNIRVSRILEKWIRDVSMYTAKKNIGITVNESVDALNIIFSNKLCK